MEIRPLDAPPLAGAAFARAESALALAGLIGSIGDAAFGQRGIEHLNRLLPIGWWAVYRLFDDAPPRLLAGGHLDAADCIADSFAAYRGGLYREDEAFGLSRERVRAGATPVMTYLHARELRRAHRQRIYTRHGLSERLSVLGPDRDGALLPAGPPPPGARPDAPRPAVLAALPRRESEVCERLLRGWTHDGVAADLGISPTTVKTYRDRAFERLGIHHRHQLFALALDEVAQSTPRRTDAAGDRR
jgi:DNA-binding CsgD family transcriptional regulator